VGALLTVAVMAVRDKYATICNDLT
jgi:hypothetical protein